LWVQSSQSAIKAESKLILCPQKGMIYEHSFRDFCDLILMLCFDYHMKNLGPVSMATQGNLPYPTPGATLGVPYPTLGIPLETGPRTFSNHTHLQTLLIKCEFKDPKGNLSSNSELTLSIHEIHYKT